MRAIFGGLREKGLLGLFWLGDRVEVVAERTSEKLRQQTRTPMDAKVRLAMEIAAVFALVTFVDRHVAFGPATRLLYLIPVYVATSRGGGKLGLGMALIVSLLGLITDYREGLHGLSVAFDFLVRIAVFSCTALVVDGRDQMLRETQEEAMRDPLTGAYNRMATEKIGRKAIDRALLAGTPLTVAMIDCDKFKQLNDVHGHAYGDQVLKALVRSLRTSGDAYVGRTGGDEFVLFFPSRTVEQVRDTLDQATEAFTDATLILGGKAGFSYGVAAMGPQGVTLESLLDSADRDMYVRKITRRSAVVA